MSLFEFPDTARLICADTGKVLNAAEIRVRMNGWNDVLLRHGARRIALTSDSSVDWALLDLACLDNGTLLAPLPTYLSAAQREGVLDSLQPDLWISDDANTVTDGRLLGQCDGLTLFSRRVTREPQVPEGCQKITFTSGSTGSPKGVCLSAKAQLDVAKDLVDRVHEISTATPRHLCLLPLPTLLENIAGIYSPLMAGGDVIVASDALRGFSGSRVIEPQKMLALIQEWQPRSLILVPELLKFLLMASAQGWRAPQSLEFIAVGGAQVSQALLQQAALAGLPVFQGYGLSECSSVVALSTQSPAEAGDSVGLPLPCRNIRIDDGELVVRTPFLGYLGMPDTASDEVRTGDLVEQMADGRLRIVGRRKNLIINSFGRNISPEWVETALTDTGIVTQAILLGDAKPWCGALVFAPPGITDAALQGAIDRVNATLPDYAHIQRFRRLSAAFSPVDGTLTINGRLRRDNIQLQHAELVASLFQGETP